MNTFLVNDYTMFDTAVTTTVLRQSRLIDDFNAVSKAMNELNNEDVFCGPCCNSVVDGWNILKTPLQNSINELSKASVALKENKLSYQLSDKSNALEIGGLGYGG